MKNFAVLRKMPDGRFGLLNIVPVHGSDEHKLAQAETSAQRLAQGWRSMFKDAHIVVSLHENLNGCMAVNNIFGFVEDDVVVVTQAAFDHGVAG